MGNHTLNHEPCPDCGDLDGCHLARLVPILKDATSDLTRDVLNCMNLFGCYNSLHEVLGVLQEEVLEFNEQVYLKQSLRETAKVEAELMDIAQVAVRAIVEIRAGKLKIGK